MIEKTTTVANPTTADEKKMLPAGTGGIQIVAEQRLRQSSYFALRYVACEYHEGVLILRGRVPSFYLSQIAQTLVRKVDGVELVVNRLEVDY